MTWAESRTEAQDSSSPRSRRSAYSQARDRIYIHQLQCAWAGFKFPLDALEIHCTLWSQPGITLE